MNNALRKINQTSIAEDLFKYQEDDQSELQFLSSVVQELKQKRIEIGKELQQVSQILHIPYIYLEAIEKADLKALPERAYTLGFVQSYAKYLELDYKRVILRFKGEVLKDEPLANYSLPVPINNNALPKKPVIYVTIAIFMLTVATAWHYINSKSFPQHSLTSSADKESYFDLPNGQSKGLASHDKVTEKSAKDAYTVIESDEYIGANHSDLSYKKLAELAAKILYFSKTEQSINNILLPTY